MRRKEHGQATDGEVVAAFMAMAAELRLARWAVIAATIAFAAVKSLTPWKESQVAVVFAFVFLAIASLRLAVDAERALQRGLAGPGRLLFPALLAYGALAFIGVAWIIDDALDFRVVPLASFALGVAASAFALVRIPLAVRRYVKAAALGAVPRYSWGDLLSDKGPFDPAAAPDTETRREE